MWVRLTTSTVQQEIVGPKGTDKGAVYYKRDVYELDENLFHEGPYFNARAAHTEGDCGGGCTAPSEEGGRLHSGRILKAKMR
jgi:hypothetical protein